MIVLVRLPRPGVGRASELLAPCRALVRYAVCHESCGATFAPTAPLPAPSLYTKNAVAFFAPGSPCGVRSRWSLTCTPSAHRREVGGQRRGHVLRPLRAATRFAAYGCIERDRLCGGRSAKPRGAAPELGRHYAAAGRATSHNGARYAFVRSKTPSHVALSGAPPRPSPLKKSGSRTRHIF